MNWHNKKAYLLLLFASYYLPVHAQWYAGISSGATNNYLITNNANQAFTDYTNAVGFSIGVPISYRFEKAKWLAISIEPTFLQKNYSINRAGYFSGIYQNVTNNYAQLPLMLRGAFGGALGNNEAHKMFGLVNVGGYVGYWASGEMQGVSSNPLDTINYAYDETYRFNTTTDNRWEFGTVVGLGVMYELKNAAQFFIEARYYRSLTDQQKQYMLQQTPHYNDTYTLSMGILLNFSNTESWW